MCVHISTRKVVSQERVCNLSNSPNAATEARAHAQTCAKPSLTRPSEAAQISETHHHPQLPPLVR
jgi:hypothetical protein